MYWGLLACTFVAFSASTEFIPELNTRLRLVPFSAPFKTYLTVLMIADYCGCWVVEQILKRAFSDFRPKDMALRRPDQLEKEEKRRQERLAKVEQERIKALEKAQEAKEKVEQERIEALGRKAKRTT